MTTIAARLLYPDGHVRDASYDADEVIIEGNAVRLVKNGPGINQIQTIAVLSLFNCQSIEIKDQP